MIAINPIVLNNKKINTHNTPIKPSCKKDTMCASCPVVVSYKFLNSKFDINFRGVKQEPCDFLDNFSVQFENTINDMLFPCDVSDNKCAIRSSDDIKLINRQFKQDGISSIYPSGISLNNALEYLSVKKQIEFDGTKKPTRAAFFIDRLSVEYFKNLDKNSLKFHQLLGCMSGNLIKFYCLSSDKKEALDLINQMKEAIGVNVLDVTIIENKPDNNANHPDAKTIKAVIRTLAQYKFPNDTQQQKEFEQIVSKYLQDCFMAFSYQSLAKLSSKHYQLIEKIVQAKGRTMDDVYYLIPRDSKSYDITNYIYATVNNIPSNKFLNLPELTDKGSAAIKEDKIYVVIDDLCASGDSFNAFMGENNLFFRKAGKTNLIFSPIIATYYSISEINAKKDSYKERLGMDLSFAPLKLFRDFRFISEKNQANDVLDVSILLGLYDDNEVDRILSESLDDKPTKQVERYINNYSTLSYSDIQYLRRKLLMGCGGVYLSVIFPYMIPDNSSDIATLLGGYFLNTDHPSANKGVDNFTEIPQGVRIPCLKYAQLKQNIKNLT